MDNVSQMLLAFFTGIITVAIVSVIVSRKSASSDLIRDVGTSLSKVVSAAVNPVSDAYGHGNGDTTFSNPLASGLSTIAPKFSFLGILP